MLTHTQNQFAKIHKKYQIILTREESIEQYKQYLLQNNDLLKQLPSLQGAVLGCWCKPALCHGDILADFCNKGIPSA